MEPAEMLGTSAQIAITMAGFAGVVVVFGRRAVHEWSAVDKFRLRLLLGTSTSALAFCLVGLLLLSSGLDFEIVWRACSAVVVVVFACNIISSLRTYARFPRDELRAQGARPWLFYLIASIGGLASVLQLCNVFAWRAFWPFFAAVVLALLIATLQFVRMILAPREI
jgi:hypothetical protein